MVNLYSVKCVAKQLNIGYRKVLDLIALGEIEAYKVGGVFRISSYAIHKYLSSIKYKSQVFK